jgi:hypothetical protein
LTCFADHVQLDECKGEAFIFGETEVITMSSEGQPFGISLATPFEPIRVAASNPEDQTIWVNALRRTVNQAKLCLRGYILKRSSMNDGQFKKKYFVLHQDAVSYHKDKSHLGAGQGCIYLNAETIAEFNDNLQLIEITDPNSNQKYVHELKHSFLIERSFLIYLYTGLQKGVSREIL